MNTLSHPGSPSTWLSAICCPGSKGQKRNDCPEAHYLILSHSGILSLHWRAHMHWRGKTVTNIPIYFILILKRLRTTQPEMYGFGKDQNARSLMSEFIIKLIPIAYWQCHGDIRIWKTITRPYQVRGQKNLSTIRDCYKFINRTRNWRWHVQLKVTMSGWQLSQ